MIPDAYIHYVKTSPFEARLILGEMLPSPKFSFPKIEVGISNLFGAIPPILPPPLNTPNSMFRQ
mgnify:CR=1 FL=1